MSTLQWRTADVELADKLVPQPNAEHQLLDRLSNVRVAIDNGFLHIDPRPNSAPAYPGNDTYTVQIVPAHLVRRVSYRVEPQTEPELIEVRAL